MKPNEMQQIEMDLLIEAIFRRYGYDFKHYAKASIHRRIHHYCEKKGISPISNLISLVIHDPQVMQSLLLDLSITVTELFRDPSMFVSLRKNVIPYLKSYPSIKIWHAGCATGQEAYSLAILLEEEQVLKKAVLYATDFNDAALDIAKQGIYEMDQAKTYIQNYQAAGGKYSLSEYFHAQYNAIVFKSDLKSKIMFANHNLATDGVFSEMQMVFCRNVMIYFDRVLQEKALKLFDESLVDNGFLCLGKKETLQFSSLENRFELIDEQNRIYQKKHADK